MNNVQTIMLLLGAGLTLSTIVFVFGIRGLFLRNGDASEDSEPRKSTSAHRNPRPDTLQAPEPQDDGDRSFQRQSAALKDTWIGRVTKGPQTKKIVTAGGGRVVVTPPLGSEGDEDVLRVLEDAAHQVRTHLKNQHRAA